MSAADDGDDIVLWALEEAGYEDLKGFLLAHSGYTLTEMAEVLGVDVGEFVSYHNTWVERHAPDPLNS